MTGGGRPAVEDGAGIEIGPRTTVRLRWLVVSCVATVTVAVTAVSVAFSAGADRQNVANALKQFSDRADKLESTLDRVQQVASGSDRTLVQMLAEQRAQTEADKATAQAIRDLADRVTGMVTRDEFRDRATEVDRRFTEAERLRGEMRAEIEKLKERTEKRP